MSPDMGEHPDGHGGAEESQQEAASVIERIEQRAPEGAPRTTVHYAGRVVDAVMEHHILDFSASLAFRLTFAAFPLIIFVLILLAVAGATYVLEDAVDAIVATEAVPDDMGEPLQEQVERMREDESGLFRVSAIVAGLLGLWMLSSAFRTLMTGMNRLYEVQESRSFLPRFGMSILVSLVLVTLLLLATVLAVGGAGVAEALAGWIGLDEELVAAWRVLRWPLLAACVLLAYAITYHVAPNVQRRFSWVTRGAVISFLLWLLFAYGFSIYVEGYARYELAFGAFTGVVVLLLYMYYSAFTLFLGAVINRVYEREHGAAAENPQDSGDG